MINTVRPGTGNNWRLRFSSDADNVRLTNVCIIIIIICVETIPSPRLGFFREVFLAVVTDDDGGDGVGGKV